MPITGTAFLVFGAHHCFAAEHTKTTECQDPYDYYAQLASSDSDECTGHSYIGHNYVGHSYIGHRRQRRGGGRADEGGATKAAVGVVRQNPVKNLRHIFGGA